MNYKYMITDKLANPFKKWIHDPRNKICLKGFLIFSVLSYFYFAANNLDNYDNVVNAPTGYGVGVHSGRWLLSYLGDFLNNLDLGYNVPFFNLLIALLCLGFSAILVVNILRIQSKLLCFSIGAITAAFPVIAATLFFAFTVHFYCLGILLGTLGVFLAQKKRWYSSVFSALCFSFSLGLYQAYFPFIAALLVLVLIRDTLDNCVNWKQVLLDSFLYLALLIFGYGLYRLFLQLSLMDYETELYAYQGLDSMGKISLARLPWMIRATYSNVLMLFRRNYCSISPTKIIRGCVLLLYLFVAVFTLLQWRKRDLLKNIELTVFLILLPIAADSIEIMVPYGGIYTIMLYGMIAVFYLPVLLADRLWENISIKRVATIFVSAAIVLAAVDYAYCSNVNYRALYYQNRKTENYYTVLFSRITATEGYQEDMEIVFIGDQISDSSISDAWGDLNTDYGGRHIRAIDAINSYPLSRQYFIQHYLGQTMRYASENETTVYSPFFGETETYPNSGSIKILDNIVFVNCG